MKVRVLRIALFAAASVLLASCGAILEEATERAVERGLEEGGVDVDLDDLADGEFEVTVTDENGDCLLYTSPSPRDLSTSRMPSSA